MKPHLYLLVLFAGVALRADDVWLSAVVNARDAEYDMSRPALNRTPTGKALTLAGREFGHGVGTQVDTRIAVTLGGATRFTALAGVDDSSNAGTTLRFTIEADGETLWQREIKAGEAPAEVNLALQGKKQLVLLTTDIGNAATLAVADWADAKLIVDGEPPKSSPPPAMAEAREILTPPAPAAPRINGARVFGVRPGHPFLFTIAATGERPMEYSADGLPDGVSLDPASGQISGRIEAPGSRNVTLRAKNGRGVAESKLRIEVGERIALTPPLGWNSWNCWGISVDQAKVLASAQAMADKGLRDHGWTYINIDDTWQGERTGTAHALQGNEKFPNLKKLCDQVHALGLKVGIYSTPWITSYARYPGGSADNPEGTWPKATSGGSGRRLGKYSFADPDAKQWAAWGIDYLKYDWNPNRVPETQEMAHALRASGRDIVYSLSNNAPFANAAELSALANCWRTTGDITDTWASLRGIWSQQEKWRPFGRPGHWNDPDMLVVGEVDVGRGRSLHPSRLTPNEQYTHLSLWCLLSAPLLIGCPIERLDEFTLNLLTNDEVLAIDQDELGTAATLASVDGRKQIYLKPLADGSRAIGVFNLAQERQEVSLAWAALGLEKPGRIRDLWRQHDLPGDAEQMTVSVPRHGVVLLRTWPAK